MQPSEIEAALSMTREELLKSFAGADRLSVLAPGVIGIRHDAPDAVRIPAIQATVEGSGAIGRYLDSLPRDRDVIFPAVISERLEEMLRRRGFVDGTEFSWKHAEYVGVMVRRAVPESDGAGEGDAK